MYTNDSCSHDCFHCADSFDNAEDGELHCKIKEGQAVADDGYCDDWKPKLKDMQ